MTYIKQLTKIEVIGTDLIRGYYDEMMFEVHLNGPNFQTDVICGKTIFIDEPSDLAKKVFKELEEYLKADDETRIKMLGAEKLVRAIDNVLDEYAEVVLASNCPEVDELGEALEGFLSGLNDGQLTESIKEMEKVLQDFIFYVNIEKERQGMSEMKNLNFEQLDAIVNEVNSWDRSLDYLEAFHMDEFDEILCDLEAFEVAMMVVHGDFKPYNSEYFRFDGYGNLESLTRSEYKAILKDDEDYIIERAMEVAAEGGIDLEDIMGMLGD